MDVADLVHAADAAAAPGMTRLAAKPLAHFLALGAVLALGRALVADPATDPSRVIAVTPALLDRLAAGGGAAPGEAGDRSSLDAWIDDEVLYREGVRRGLAWNPGSIGRFLQVGRFLGDDDADAGAALADVQRLGLDREDPVVRAQVVGRMRIRLRAAAMRAEPSDADLQRWFRAHAARFRRPARVSFAHVFVRRDRGSAAAAEAILDRVRAERLPVARALRLGDVFRPGERFESWSPHEVEALLGPDVARAAMTQPERAWSPPVRSPYGWHLVWVEARTPDAGVALAAVRDRVRQAWQAEQAQHAVAERIRALRAEYRVEVDPAAEARLRPDRRRG